MKYTILYLVTVIISIIMDKVSELRYYRDAASYGYKINREVLNKLKEEDVININNEVWEYILPFCNVLSSLANTVRYKEQKNDFFAIMQAYGGFLKMTSSEEEEYNSNPSLFNAYKISALSKYRLKDASQITVKDDLSESTIYYKNSMNKYRIIGINGPLINKTREEQEKIFLDAMEEYLNNNIKKIEESLPEHKHEYQNIISKIDQIDELKKLRQELIEQRDKTSGKKYIKK